MSRSESRACVTGSDLNFVVGTRATLTTVKRFHPDVERYCFSPATQVGEVQRQLGELAMVLPIPRTLAGVPEKWMPSYARVFIPDVIRADIVAWIDSDAILVARADRLWDVAPGSVNLVRDVVSLPWMVTPEKWADYCTVFPDLDSDSWAFNAGVFAFRPAEWIGLDAKFEKFIDSMSYDTLPFVADQLFLNGLFRSHLRFLPREYNTTGFHEESVGIPLRVRILHYAGQRKPWSFGYPKLSWAIYYWEKYGLGHSSGATTLRWLQVFLTLPVRVLRRIVRKARFLAGMRIKKN